MKKRKLKGINGWLLLFTIFFIIRFIVYSILTVSIFYSTEKEAVSISNLVLISIIMLFIAFFHLYTLFLEFKMKKDFPRWAILTLWFALILGNLSTYITNGINAIIKSPISLLIEVAIYGTITEYLIKSERVKNTFTKI